LTAPLFAVNGLNWQKMMKSSILSQAITQKSDRHTAKVKIPARRARLSGKERADLDRAR
jgi:hypothetical protein